MNCAYQTLFQSCVKRSLSTHSIQVMLLLSVLIWTANCTQFLLENWLKDAKFWDSSDLTESEQSFRFPHTSRDKFERETVKYLHLRCRRSQWWSMSSQQAHQLPPSTPSCRQERGSPLSCTCCQTDKRSLKQSRVPAATNIWRREVIINMVSSSVTIKSVSTLSALSHQLT